MNNRLLGILCIIGGLAYAGSGVMIQLAPQPDARPVGFNLLVNSLFLVSAIGFFCGALGIFNLRVTGTQTVARVLTGIPLVTLPVLMVGAVMLMAGMQPPPPVTLIGLVGTMLGATIIGILALIARRWEGWRKFTPFGHLVALGLALATGIVINVLVGLAWVAIGYAVLTTESAPAAQKTGAAPSPA